MCVVYAQSVVYEYVAGLTVASGWHLSWLCRTRYMYMYSYDVF